MPRSARSWRSGGVEIDRSSAAAELSAWIAPKRAPPDARATPAASAAPPPPSWSISTGASGLPPFRARLQPAGRSAAVVDVAGEQDESQGRTSARMPLLRTSSDWRSEYRPRTHDNLPARPVFVISTGNRLRLPLSICRTPRRSVLVRERADAQAIPYALFAQIRLLDVRAEARKQAACLAR